MEVPKDKDFHFIYKTTCIITGKIYIGMHSTNIIDDGYIGYGIYNNKCIDKKLTKGFHAAVNEHGYHNFKREIIEFCDSRQNLAKRESFFIYFHNSLDPNIGYNIDRRGERSEETKLKIKLGCQRKAENRKRRERRIGCRKNGISFKYKLVVVKRYL